MNSFHIKTKKLVDEFILTCHGFRLLYKISPQSFLWRTVNCIVQQLSPYFSLYMSARIIDKIAVNSERRELIALSIITVVGILIINITVHFVNRKAEETQSLFLQINELYFLKAQCEMQYKYYDDPKTAQLRQTIRNHATYGGYGLNKLNEVYCTLISGIINIILSISLTISIFSKVEINNSNGFLDFINSPFSTLILIILIFINVFVRFLSNSYFGRKNSDIWNERNLNLAKSNAYISNQPESRIFNFPKFSLPRNQEVLVKAKYISTLNKNAINQNLITIPLMAFMNIGLAIYVCAKAYIGVCGIGDYILYKGTIERFVNAISGILGNIGILRYNNSYLKEIFAFLEFPNKMRSGELPLDINAKNNYQIEFRNVYFKYPNSDTYIFENLSFILNEHEKIAFVGMNGSGKSTVIKLLCRLYDPDDGQIFLNGIDIKSYNYDDYLRLFSVVFQDFYTFGFSLGENIAADEDYDPNRVKAVIKSVGLEEKVKTYPKAFATVITRQADDEGVDVSLGEAQKIALARAMYKDAPIVVLDEPTAALDPVSENDIYSSFNELNGEKTVIYVSHRLSSCRFCDRILVFDQGKIVQSGNHDELMKCENGKYYELWNAQAQYYFKN